MRERGRQHYCVPQNTNVIFEGSVQGENRVALEHGNSPADSFGPRMMIMRRRGVGFVGQ